MTWHKNFKISAIELGSIRFLSTSIEKVQNLMTLGHISPK